MLPQRFVNQPGFATLLGVLVITTLGVSLTLGILTMSVNTGAMALVFERLERTKTAVNSCAEMALLQIQTDPTFTGTQTPILDEGECTFTSTSLPTGDGNYETTLEITGTYQTATRKIGIAATATNPASSTPVIILTSWQELAAF